MIPTLRGMVLVLVAALPWLALLPAGMVWVWQQGYLYLWLGAAVAVTALAALWWRLAGSGQTMHKPRVEADRRWADRDQAVWQAVEAQAASIRLQDYPLDARLPHRLLDLGLATLREVAHQYHSDRAEPELAVPVPHVLQSAERVCRDLRALTEYVPLSHLITLEQWKRAPHLARLAQLYDGWRLARLVINPGSAMMAELRGALQGRLLASSRDELQLWLLQEFVRGTGRHAIDLYGGNLALADQGSTGPVRVVVLGQKGSGKTSIACALYGPGLAEPGLTVIDTAGHDAMDGKQRRALADTVLEADLVLLACAAHQAARAPDRAVVDLVREVYAAHHDRCAPPVVCALTHVDRLRPVREWSPPYDIVRAAPGKAATIRAAVEHVAATLGLDSRRVIPVRCDPGHEYNVDEALVPRILESLEDASRARHLRVLRAHLRAGNWKLLLRQTVNAGRVLGTVAARAVRSARPGA